ncbi:MAG: hypothetical protein PVH63_10440 [Balneolaceae bacterium]|jgi:hypothetical protein
MKLILKTIFLLLFVLFSQNICLGTDIPSDSTTYISYHNITQAQNFADGNGVKVAVLDWMFDLNPEAAKKYIDPVSLVPGQHIGVYKAWHGEWMAKIIHRIAPKAAIMPIRARPKSKKNDNKGDVRPYQKYLVKGIRYAADHGADFITNSMGPVKQTPELTEAVRYAAEKGAVFIDVHPEYVKVKNGKIVLCHSSKLNPLIMHPGIVSVADHPRRSDSRRDFYTYPYDIDPVYKDGWGYSNGPPITAGIAALMKSVDPKLKINEIKKILIETADLRNGFKVIDAQAAVLEVRSRRNK